VADSPNRNPWLASYKPDATPRPRLPGEHLWTLTNGDQLISCELRTTVDVGVEAQLFRNAELYKGRWFRDRAGALEHARRCRLVLEADGWTAGPP